MELADFWKSANRLSRVALAAAALSAVILLGDVPYYARFGFSAFKTGSLLLPGPFERDRLLAVELREAALEGASGLIVPTGARVSRTRRCNVREIARPMPRAA